MNWGKWVGNGDWFVEGDQLRREMGMEMGLGLEMSVGRKLGRGMGYKWVGGEVGLGLGMVRTILALGYWVLPNIFHYWVVLGIG